MRAVMLALAVVLSIIPLWPVYESSWFFVALGGGAVLGTLIALWSARRSWSVLRTVLVSVLAYLVFGVPLAVPSQTIWGVLPTLIGELNLVSGVVLSWKQLVTVVPPVGTYEALLVPVLVLAFTGVELAILVTLRGRGGRSLWAPLVPVLTLGLSLWLGPTQPFAGLLVTVLVFALIAMWFVLSRPGVSRGGIGAAVVLLVAVVVSGSVVVVSSALNRTVWRTEIEQPFVLQENTSPLSEYRSYVLGDRAEEVMLTATGLSVGDRLSLATLNRYTGVVFSVGGQAADFTKLPGSIAPVNTSGVPVSVAVEIDQLTGPWVPLPGELGSVRFNGSQSAALTDSFYYSRPAQTGAVVRGLNTGNSYTSTAQASAWVSVSELASLTPGDALIPAPEVMPEGVDTFISAAAKGKTNPADRLQAALQALLSQGYVSHGGPGEVASASGHGANRISALFASRPMVGDAEQYAAAAALIATESGFPARVVMGFIAPEGSAADAAQPFTGDQMTAWIEISTTEGWRAFNPNPLERPIPDQQPEDPTEVAFPQTAVDPPAQEEQQLNDTTSPEATQEEEPTPVDPVLQTVLAVVTVVGWTALWLGILASPLIVIATVKRLRTRRRVNAAEAEDRVLGAWDEVRDQLQDYGVSTPLSQTRIEIASLLSSEAALMLARDADAAQFSAEEVDDAQAQVAWQHVASVKHELAKQHTRWQRITSRLSLASVHSVPSWLSKRMPWRR